MWLRRHPVLECLQVAAATFLLLWGRGVHAVSVTLHSRLAFVFGKAHA